MPCSSRRRLFYALMGAGLALIGTMLAFPRRVAGDGDPQTGSRASAAPIMTTKKAAKSFPAGAQIYFGRRPGKTRLATL